ncbi:MAG TPA: Uma2 family endonuclease [Candidatus Binatia bacterium]|nr:Uma2 family endonuclease [Candidatus Binatia bacterium]
MPADASEDSGYTVEQYFGLAERGMIRADDHVELLEGLIVASPPQSALHASVTMCVDQALRKAIGDRASIRVQMPLVLGPRSAPEPDLAMVEGRPADYRDHHPGGALLVVEIADSSLPHDRLSKSRIYARAKVREYWILNLRERVLEVHRAPDAAAASYRAVITFESGDVVELSALPGASVPVADLFPGY